MQNNPEVRILKFRSFISKEEEGFVIVFDHHIPEIVLEDLLCQLFAPIFEGLPCPDIYYFSSTDEILSYSDALTMKDYIYVHFLQRTKHQQIRMEGFKIGDLEKLSQGINFKGVNLFVFSEKAYSMYGSDSFSNMIEKKIVAISQIMDRKKKRYNEALHDLNKLKDNMEFVELKEEIDLTMEDYTEKLGRLESISHRYRKAKTTLRSILQASGIQIRELKDLYWFGLKQRWKEDDLNINSILI